MNNGQVFLGNKVLNQEINCFENSEMNIGKTNFPPFLCRRAGRDVTIACFLIFLNP
jgi:hypothetical protein